MPVKRRQNLAVTGRGSYYKEERLEFLDSKCAFYNGHETHNDDKSYDENNEQQQLPEGFANSCYKIVAPVFYIISFVQTNRLYINHDIKTMSLNEYC